MQPSAQFSVLAVFAESVVACWFSGGKTWQKYKGNPVWGGGRPNAKEAAGQPWVYRESADKYWLYTTSNGKPYPSVHIASSTDGLSWTNVTDGAFLWRFSGVSLAFLWRF